jgi:hypothetical protein
MGYWGGIMSKLPDPEITVENLVDDYQEQELPRPHLGISQIGHPCDRWLWLSFRWAVIEKFPGRILRLFRRGQMEEATVVSDLRRAGFDVSECLNQQRYLDFGCHVGGSPDGVIYGIPEAMRTLHTLEIKTHSKKSFDDYLKHGVQKSKPMHYIQMQCYMRKRKTKRALYYPVCKDDDRVCTERVRLDAELADKYIERGHRIALSERLPEPLSTDPSWYQCKFCAAHDFCFGSKVPEVNCRTCAHATPEANGTWTCARWNAVIPVEAQRTGCRSHVIHPDLVKAQMSPYDNWSCYYDGVLVGEAGISTLEYLHGTAGKVSEVFEGEIIE